MKFTKLPWEESQPTKKNKEVAVEQKEEYPIFSSDELPYFIEEEEEEKVVPIFLRNKILLLSL